ncbi:hypothetical protein [Nonomuraea sp. NPDC050310]|uniref:hypothetical protein n=1 Tax=Nonomuraea sp. NPDC050310 TaxID=3154935 RepID=UPI00340856B9
MRRASVATVLSLALACAACAQQPAAPPKPSPSSTASPTAAAAATLAAPSTPPVRVTNADCPEPPRPADQFRVTTTAATWKLLDLPERPGALRGGTPGPGGELWAVHDKDWQQGTPVRLTGGDWTDAGLPPGMTTVHQLTATPGGQVWVATPAADAWQVAVHDGGGWRALSIAAPKVDNQPSLSGGDGGWVSYADAAVHWDGARWTHLRLPEDQGPEVGTEQPLRTPYRLAASGGEVWALPYQGSRAVRIRDGVPQQVWFELKIDKRGAIHDNQGGAFYPQAVAVPGPDETWVFGSAAFGTHDSVDAEDTAAGRLVALREAGGRWTCTWGPFHREGFSDTFQDAVEDGRGGVWVATDGKMWHFADGRWTGQPLPVGKAGRPIAQVMDLVRAGDEVYALGAIVTEGTSHAATWRLTGS